MDRERASTLARESGFEIVEPLDIKNLKFRQDVRDMCSPEMCPQGYGHSWSCPPEAPALETLRGKAQGFSQGVIVQTIGQLEDSFDFESILETTQVHGKHFVALADALGDETEGRMLPLGAGACPRCAACTYPDSPCVFPDELIISMEASGLLVNEVCTENGILYNNGENTVTFTSCCLF